MQFFLGILSVISLLGGYALVYVLGVGGYQTLLFVPVIMLGILALVLAFIAGVE